MKSKHPFISVIVPFYNAGETMEQCLQSLLDQDYPSDRYEVILVDNNSKDQTKEIVQRFPVKLTSETKQGISPARNRGAHIARGNMLVFFDADQFAEKDYLSKIIEGCDNEAYGAFASRNVGLNSSDTVAGSYWIGEWKSFENKNKGICSALSNFSGGNVAVKRDAFQKLGGFDEDLVTAEDLDLAWRIQKNLKLKIKQNKNAVCTHQERSSVGSLLKREFFFGYGVMFLAKRHDEAYRSIFFDIWRATKRTILGILALALGLIKWILRKCGFRKLQIILLDMAMHWANCFGRIYGHFKSREYSRKCKVHDEIKRTDIEEKSALYR